MLEYYGARRIVKVVWVCSDVFAVGQGSHSGL